MKGWHLYVCFILVGYFACDSFQLTERLPDGIVFDFIVVGGGVGGCVVAGRLAESGKHKVLLISEGGLSHPDFEIPALALNPTLLSDPKFVKVYSSVPQRNIGLAQNGTMTFLVGKSLGGGSAINEMFMNRGSPHDYNNWAKLTGDESWNYANLLKYFRKFENYAGFNPSSHRGFGGPITVSPPSYAPGLAEILKGGTELGYGIGDPNGPQTESFTWVDFSKKNGRRVNAFNGYIEPLLRPVNTNSRFKESNLLILTNTKANRIIFKGNRAVGVTLTSNSTGQLVSGYVEARNEIILSAGTVDTPILLMKSGIGKKSVLDKANIRVIKNIIGVGENLQEHMTVPLTVILNRSAAFDPERDLTPEAWRTFEETGAGPYSSSLGAGGQSFITSAGLAPSEKLLNWPDLQLAYANANTSATAALIGSLPEPDDLKEWEIPVAWNSVLGRPKSRGSVTLNLQNIEDAPLIDYKFLTRDLHTLVDGLKIIVKLCENTTALQGIGCRIPSTPFPACNHFRFRSDAYWLCYASQTTAISYHASGTCKMGSALDPKAVVDTELSVIGMEGIKIVDASTLGTITNANIQAVVYAIAEKGADMILRKWDQEANQLSHY